MATTPDQPNLVPPAHQRSHEFCFFIHDQMLALLQQYEASGAHNLIRDGFMQVLVESGRVDQEVDMLKFLKDHGLVQPYKHYIVAHLVLALTSDMLHFLYEALRCFEKRKFTVGFALLRKPLKENLLFLCWLLADRDDFITRFEANTYTTLNGIQPERRKALITGAITKVAIRDLFDVELLHEMIFSKTAANGLEPMWQRATHLITSQGDLLKTEDLNINFIFHDFTSDDFYEHAYKSLPYVMTFALNVVLECFALILKYNEHTVSHLLITTMGCYETLFDIKPRNVIKMLSKELKSLLKCIHCGARLRLTRANATEMFMREHLHCFNCRLTSPFPLYWVLGSAKFKLTHNDGSRPILDDGE